MKKSFIGMLIIVAFIKLTSFQAFVADTFSQPQTQSTQNNALIHNASLQVDGNSSVTQKVDRLDTEIKSLEKRFEDFFKYVTYFGALLGVFVAFLTIYSVFRTWQQHKDYLSERRFYEERAINLEDRQKLSFEHAIQMSNKTSEHNEKSSNQQFQLGENILSRSSEILTQQIQNIEKLGAVIDLVRNTFDLQLKREESQSELLNKLTETNEIVDQFKKEFQKKYADATKLILSFENVKAMEWPYLPDEAQNIVTRARSKFEDVPSFVLQEEEKKSPYVFAKVQQLIGISAYYSQDIAYAFDRLLEANRIYQSNPPRPEDTLSRAYTKHFLGIAEKNWQLETSVTGSNLKEAQSYLSEAYKMVEKEKKQFLIPVTLAEVLSYQLEQQETASELIKKILGRFTKLRNSENLDANQRSLLVRSYLLKGNLEIKTGQKQEACESFKQAFSEDPNSPFAYLSLALAQPPEEEVTVEDYWKTGLQLLERTGSVTKREITTRVTAIVWAIIAAHNCGDAAVKKGYLKSLNLTGKNIRSIAHRVPIFFSPLSKEPLKFTELKKELTQHFEKSPTNSTNKDT